MDAERLALQKPLKVLVACEESQAVTKEMRRLGHEAYSCDIRECSGGHPEWHIMGDALPLINGRCEFKTMDGKTHRIEGRWDLLIAHPPCQKLSNAGAVNMGRKDSVCATSQWRERFLQDRCDAAIFFMTFLTADCNKICVENPDGYMNTHFRKPDQHIEPYEYGDAWKKKTGLWLKGLPPLQPTQVVKPVGKWVQQNKKGRPAKSEAWEVIGTRSAKVRSKTFPGIAKAMAEQWAGETK